MSNINNNTSEWETVIGLEIHAQIATKSKLFSASSTSFGSDPNTQVSCIDAAMPGMLPVLNHTAVDHTIKTGLAINASINNKSIFDRKHYFYADLPQGYQITQFYRPIVQNGYIDIDLENNTKKKIRVNRIHIEQDAGKAIHDQEAEYSLVDLNRAGIPLMEIVSEPDLSSPYEVAEYIKKVRLLMQYLRSCDGNMDQGSLRCDVNISVRKYGDPLGTRCELKNLNSIKNIIKAIEYEVNRQIETIESGKSVTQETRLFDINSGTTKTMRNKENATDYLYFPDPDLLPLIISDDHINNLKAQLPELPDQKMNRYISEFGLSQYDAKVIVADQKITEFFEKAIENANPKTIANWLCTELFGRLNKNEISIEECKILPEYLGQLVSLIDNNTISGKIAKTVFNDMFNTGKNPDLIIKEKNLVQLSDTTVLIPIIDEIIKTNPKALEQYKAGKTQLFGFFVGQVMQKTSGKANPQTVNELLKERISPN